MGKNNGNTDLVGEKNIDLTCSTPQNKDGFGTIIHVLTLK